MTALLSEICICPRAARPFPRRLAQVPLQHDLKVWSFKSQQAWLGYYPKCTVLLQAGKQLGDRQRENSDLKNTWDAQGIIHSSGSASLRAASKETPLLGQRSWLAPFPYPSHQDKPASVKSTVPTPEA